jgi:hypothetical protein
VQWWRKREVRLLLVDLRKGKNRDSLVAATELEGESNGFGAEKNGLAGGSWAALFGIWRSWLLTWKRSRCSRDAAMDLVLANLEKGERRITTALLHA